MNTHLSLSANTGSGLFLLLQDPVCPPPGSGQWRTEQATGRVLGNTLSSQGPECPKTEACSPAAISHRSSLVLPSRELYGSLLRRHLKDLTPTRPYAPARHLSLTWPSTLRMGNAGGGTPGPRRMAG